MAAKPTNPMAGRHENGKRLRCARERSPWIPRFSLALQPVLAKAKREIEETSAAHNPFTTHPPLLAFYLDDGILVAHHRILTCILSLMQSSTAVGHGLHLKPSDTRVWWPTPMSIQHCELYPPSLSISSAMDDDDTKSIVILGSPLGTNGFMRRWLSQQIQHNSELIDKLAGMADAHCELTLIRACLGASRLNFVLRSTPKHATDLLAAEFDKHIERAVRRIAGGILERDAFRDHPHLGANLSSASSIAPPAYIASINASAHAAHSLLVRTPHHPPAPTAAAGPAPDTDSDGIRYLLATTKNTAKVAYSKL